MSSPPVRLIAIDIDGTLLPSSGLRISTANRQALRAAQAAGIEVVIATGRRQAYAAPLIGTLGLSPATTMITSNGAVTRSLGGERIDRTMLGIATARGLCGLLREYGTAVFTFDQSGPGEMVIESLSQLHERIAAWVEANRQHLIEISPLERAFDGGDPPVQGMAAGSVGEMREAELKVAASPFAAELELHRTEYPERNLSILDLLPPGVSKGWALSRHAQRRGIAREEVMAIGDNFNDVEMLGWAGHPVLMSNAPAELLEMAGGRGWRLTASNDQDGVARAVARALAGREEQPLAVSR